MKLLDWVKDKLDGDEPKAAPVRDSSAYRSQVPQAAQREAPAPKGQPAQNSAAFNARLQSRQSVPSQRDAVLSGRLGAPDTRTSLTAQEKEKERAAALSGNFSKVAAPATTREGGSEWGAVGVWAPMEPPSDGVREILNASNWTVPAKVEQDGAGSMPDTSFESFADLKAHEFRVTNEETDRVQAMFNTARAQASGYEAPRNPTVDQNMPLMEVDDLQSAALTWDAYNELGTQQQAAVDFNTLLVEAREKDLGKSYAMSDADRLAYDDEVTRLFGEGRGSDTIAKETVGLLAQLDMNLVGQDLDEYLSLERAIDTEELATFKFSDKDVKTLGQKLKTGGETTYADVRTPENLATVDTVAIQKSQQLIKTALANPDALTFDLTTLMGGPTADMQLGQPPLGFGNETTIWSNPADAEMNGWFKTAKDVLAGTITPEGVTDENRMEWLMADMPSMPGYTKESPTQFLDYLARQTQMLNQYGSDEDKTLAAMINQRAGLGG